MPYLTRKTSTKELEAILANIESSGLRHRNATSYYSYPAEWKTKLPLSFSQFGKAVVFDRLEGVEGSVSLSFLHESSPRFFESILKGVSPYAAFGITVDLNPRTSPFPYLDAQLRFELGKTFIGLGGYYSYGEFEDAASLQEIFRMAELPIMIERKGDVYRFKESAAGTTLAHAPVEAEDLIPKFIKVSISRWNALQSVTLFLSFVENPAFKPKATGCRWSLWTKVGETKFEKIAPGKLVDTINRLGFPKQSVTTHFEWHLKHYQDFREMPHLAKMKLNDVSAYLVEFEFAPGKMCRVASECDKKGVFKLWFNVEMEDDLKILKPVLAKLGTKTFRNTWA